MNVTVKTVWANMVRDFPGRKPSWAMMALNACVGLILTINPGALTTNPGAAVFFAHLLALAPPEFWRFVFVVSSTARLFSLVINGTFPLFRHSAAIRAAMSGISALIWAQIAVSIIATGLLSIGAVVYGFIALCELENVRAAVIDARVISKNGRTGGR